MHLLAIWWIWIAIALILGILELLIPSFIFLGFAFGAMAVSVLLLLPISAGPGLLLAVFSVASLVAWIVLKLTFKARWSRRKTFSHDINE